MSSENNNNNDNKDNKNKKTKKIFYQIMDKQGFYIILILCLIIVAATAFWVDNQKGDYFIGEDPTIPFEEDEQPEVILVEDDEDNDKETDETKETGKIGEGKPEEDEKIPSKDPKKDSKEKSKEKIKETPAEKDGKNGKTKETSASGDSGEISITEDMAIPVTGKLILPFADDRLVYHKTLDQWSTHKGVDIQAAEGTPVKAVLDGEVVEILNDTIMGISIVIKHDNELLTIYSNLSTDAMVEVGEKVKKGQTISAVGKTASVKTLEGPLLHFQVLKDDKFVDPELYLGEISV